MSAALLVEIGTEEIPAGVLSKARGDLETLAVERFSALRLTHGEIRVLGAPRRLALLVSDLADRQTDLSEVVTGPPAKVAFDAAGKPTKAGLAFAQKYGLVPEQLTVTEVLGKGSYVTAQRRESGVQTRALLTTLLPELIQSLPWKKSMRWAYADQAFVRPVHWIVAVFDGEVVPFELYGQKSGRATRGHRFLAPCSIDLSGSLDDYLSKLRTAFVLVDPEVRRTAIEAELAHIEHETRVKVRPDAELLAEVTNLVEYPKAICGKFDEKFLEVPEEVIVSAMRAHQRYFSTETADGKLATRFVTIAGTLTRDAAVVQHGNERVLAARLSDARFFFDEDRAVSPDEMAQKLDGVVFQAKLGTVGEKVERIRRSGIAALVGVDASAFDRAAALCKADLVSRMVGEFPDLQGVMGRHYARLAGENAAVADAILDHYLPRGATSSLPQGALGAALGVADRMDTIVGCFAVGLGPTGSADAFGLRRAALAVLNIVLDRGWRVPVNTLVDNAAIKLEGRVKFVDYRETFPSPLDEKLSPSLPPAAPFSRGHDQPENGQPLKFVDTATILDFILGRLRGLLVDGRKLAADCVDAAIAAGWYDLPDVLARATAVAHLRDRSDFEPLGVAFKRVANILKGEVAGGEPSEALFAHDSEKTLWKGFTLAREAADRAIGAQDYDAALRELATIKPAVDKFFDDVLVMDKDPAVKKNRLALLGTINATFLRIADFRQLAVSAS